MQNVNSFQDNISPKLNFVIDARLSSLYFTIDVYKQVFMQCVFACYKIMSAT